MNTENYHEIWHKQYQNSVHAKFQVRKSSKNKIMIFFFMKMGLSLPHDMNTRKSKIRLYYLLMIKKPCKQLIASTCFNSYHERRYP